jgi:hypothetical protein
MENIFIERPPIRVIHHLDLPAREPARERRGVRRDPDGGAPISDHRAVYSPGRSLELWLIFNNLRSRSAIREVKWWTR